MSDAAKLVLSLGERVKQHRLRLGWTKAKLAVKLNVHWAVVNRIEKSEFNPRVDTLIKLADLFECTTDSLLGRL